MTCDPADHAENQLQDGEDRRSEYGDPSRCGSDALQTAHYGKIGHSVGTGNQVFLYQASDAPSSRPIGRVAASPTSTLSLPSKSTAATSCQDSRKGLLVRPWRRRPTIKAKVERKGCGCASRKPLRREWHQIDCWLEGKPATRFAVRIGRFPIEARPTSVGWS